MKLCLLSLTRKKYAEKHEGRDTRAMEMDHDLLAFAEVVEEELNRLRERVVWLERKQTAKDPE